VSEEVERLRSIYHPEGDRLAMIDVVELLAGVQALMSDSSTSKGLTLEVAAATEVPRIRGQIGQLRFVILGLLLNIVDLVGIQKGGHIWMQARSVGPTVQIEISTDLPLSLSSQDGRSTELGSRADIIEHALGLPSFRQVIHAQNGDFGTSWNDPGLNVWFSLPTM
jgi:hypothetical protein